MNFESTHQIVDFVGNQGTNWRLPCHHLPTTRWPESVRDWVVLLMG